MPDAPNFDHVEDISLRYFLTEEPIPGMPRDSIFSFLRATIEAMAEDANNEHLTCEVLEARNNHLSDAVDAFKVYDFAGVRQHLRNFWAN